MLKNMLLLTMSLAAGAAMADSGQTQKYPHGLEYNRAVSYVAAAEDNRNHYRSDADASGDEFVQRAVRFDDTSNHSYACSIFANLLYKTAYGNKSLELKAKTFDATEQKGNDQNCHSASIGSVRLGG